MLSTVFEHKRVASNMQKNFRARDAVECSNVFLSAGNNPGVLKNSTEHSGGGGNSHRLGYGMCHFFRVFSSAGK